MTGDGSTVHDRSAPAVDPIIADAEYEFELLGDAIPEADRARVAALPREPKYGGSYGHDLLAAVARGWRRKAREACQEAMHYHNQARKLSPRGQFGMAVSSLIEAAAIAGATEEQIRSALQRTLDANDSTRISKLIERATDA